MPRQWSQFGRPKDTPSASPPEIKAYDSCLGLDLASLDWKDGYVNCGFVEDTLWYKMDGSDKGVAVIKLSFNLKHKVKKSLSRVECHVTFSQASGTQFHSVHRCWPSALRGSPNTEQVSKGLDLTPAAEGMGFGGSLGGMHVNKEKTDQSNWVFTSQRRVSDPATGGRYNMVVLGWEAGCGNDYVSFSGRDLYTATVLTCSEGDLILNTKLTAKRTQNESRFRVSRTSRKDATASIQITMTTGVSDNTLETHGEEAMKWADSRNDDAIPKEMANSRSQPTENRDDRAPPSEIPSSKSAPVDKRAEILNSRRANPDDISHVCTCNDRALPSEAADSNLANADSKPQQSEHVCDVKAPPSEMANFKPTKSEHICKDRASDCQSLLAPLVYANAGGSSARVS